MPRPKHRANAKTGQLEVVWISCNIIRDLRKNTKLDKEKAFLTASPGPRSKSVHSNEIITEFFFNARMKRIFCLNFLSKNALKVESDFTIDIEL